MSATFLTTYVMCLTRPTHLQATPQSAIIKRKIKNVTYLAFQQPLEAQIQNDIHLLADHAMIFENLKSNLFSNGFKLER
jgi:hypothetical protein